MKFTRFVKFVKPVSELAWDKYKQNKQDCEQ